MALESLNLKPVANGSFLRRRQGAVGFLWPVSAEAKAAIPLRCIAALHDAIAHKNALFRDFAQRKRLVPKAYRCLSVLTNRVSSAMAGVAAVRSPSFGLLGSASILSPSTFKTVAVPSRANR